jgi:hypothetical protein
MDILPVDAGIWELEDLVAILGSDLFRLSLVEGLEMSNDGEELFSDNGLGDI